MRKNLFKKKTIAYVVVSLDHNGIMDDALTSKGGESLNLTPAFQTAKMAQIYKKETYARFSHCFKIVKVHIIRSDN